MAAWMLLAVFVPMLILSSVHIHETNGIIETECTDCVHHGCHGHLTQTASWVHDCVLCQFLTLTMLTAAMAAVMVYIHVCKIKYAQPLGGLYTTCYGLIVTRGPPSV